MSAPYSRFDTLTVSDPGNWSAGAPGRSLAVLATIPRALQKLPEQSEWQIGVAERLSVSNQQAEQTDRSSVGDAKGPHAGHTQATGGFQQTHNRTPVRTAPPASPTSHAPVRPEPPTPRRIAAAQPAPLQAAGWAEGVRSIEIALAPYSQLIVLLGLLIAAGLSLMILYGAPSLRSDSAAQGPVTIPNIEIAGATADTEAPLHSPAEPSPAELGEVASATGPIGLPAGALTAERDRTAYEAAPLPYPTTQAGDAPVARLSNMVRTQEAPSDELH